MQASSKRSGVSSRLAGWAAASLGAALLAACGGGVSLGYVDDGYDNSPYEESVYANSLYQPISSCSVGAQNDWMRRYFDRWYLWSALSPKPDPAAYSSPDALFGALKYTGTDATFPVDRWSFTESTESFNRYYRDGATIGYGVSVNGLEAVANAGQPLLIRKVDPGSPGAAAGLQRGQRIVSIHGVAAEDWVARNDFSPLSTDSVGQTLSLVVRDANGDRPIVLQATQYAVTPVPAASIVTNAAGNRLGYVRVDTMTQQAESQLARDFADFKAQGVQGLVLDLRYNGGGLVSTSQVLASLAGGARAGGQVYAKLLYNERVSVNNETFHFPQPSAQAMGFGRVYVLTGQRTCSASEQLINGLRGVGVDVVGVGSATCGKPVGFLPVSQCGTTYNVVNFESVNARNEGRYFNGFAPTCSVAEDFTQPQGSAGDPLLRAALQVSATGVCPVGAARELPQSVRHAPPRGDEPGGHGGMIVRR